MTVSATGGVSPPELPLGVVLLTGLAGLTLVAAGHWRKGLILVAVAVAIAAVLRLVLPVRRAGLLVVRSRPFDVTLLALVAAGMFALTLVIPLPAG